VEHTELFIMEKYLLCWFAAELERLGLKPLIETLDRLHLSTTLPGTDSDPSTGDASDDSEGFDWLLTAAKAQRLLGHSVLLGFWVNEDVRNTSRNLMVVGIKTEKRLLS